ncbi:HTH-type transcriptional repressor CsiR [Pelagimonas phthalicica]|uniref:HTH-type transcriptional repressor CsiR n=1 Tax=Pelagimonas phthalicica TaxID=1037362 RepID=A0A238JFB2_9RHOB|nr:GntR family transcriptional regulator [Pelagimonas phthalicica]TDS91799.1 GntR family transcriptional regulator [Pelagimonas phthalicica]SMX28847.1 HTH-type transcriptional repressor CsiR [Pelagimonas phthalicica]
MADIPLSTKIAQTLAEEIIRSDFQPGDRLAQDHIAKRFECSHVPVREALGQLVTMELAEAVPRRGVRVVKLSSDDIRDIRDMRLALEPFAVSLAASRVTPAQLSEIDDLRLSCDRAQDAVSWERANRDFHLAILRPCGRKRLLKTAENLQNLSAWHFHVKWSQGWRRKSDPDHLAITLAMKKGDGPTASAVLKRHLSRG